MSRPLCCVGLCCLLLGACAAVPVDGPASYVVRPQDTLYSVAWRHNLDFRDLARWNGIGADYRISVGQILLLAPPAVAPAAAGRHPRVSPPAGPVHGRESSPVPGTVGGMHQWVWPTDRIGTPRAVQGGGILLAGRLGQDVRAANAGRVVYAGNGIRGYGNLIIVKHADSLLSAYAHNQDVLVHDGQDVAKGQVIAHMGEALGHGPMLYFEIRQNGKPIDPLPFISR